MGREAASVPVSEYIVSKSAIHVLTKFNIVFNNKTAG